jgi:hypothetical protein
MTDNITQKRLIKIEVLGFGKHILTPFIETLKSVFKGKIVRNKIKIDVVRLKIIYKGKHQTLNLTKGDTVELDRNFDVEIK